MKKRKEVMPDGKRYIIYYTFGDKGTGNREEGKVEKAVPSNPHPPTPNPQEVPDNV